MKKQILIILPSLQQGGLFRSLKEAFDVVDLAEHKITVYVYSHNNPCLGRLPEQIRIIADTDHTHYHRRPKALLLHLRILFSKILNDKDKTIYLEEQLHSFVHEKKAEYPAKHYFSDGVDVVISYAMGLCTEMAVNIKADKKYLFFHSSNPGFHSDIAKKCFDHFDNIIAVGKNVQNMLIEAYPKYRDKIALIRNYLDAGNIRWLSDAYKVDTDLYNKKYVLTSVIRIDKEKGADLLVSAASMLKQNGISFIWFIVGDGSCRNDIEQYIIENSLNDDVVITGYKDNPYPYIKCCDIFVHPAYEESFGLAILEALALGKAVVSTDTMGAREVLDDGNNGLLVSIDPKSISEGVLELINSPDLKEEFEKSYTNKNEEERIVYKEKWTAILDGRTL